MDEQTWDWNEQLILEIRATYRLVSFLLADNWLICRLREQCKISNNNINSGSLRRCVCRHFLQNNIYIYKTIIRFGFCDILNNQGRGKCYQARPSARLLTLPLPWLFRISEKPHPIIVYYQQNEPDSHDCQPLVKIGWNSLLVRPLSFRTIKLISNHSWFLCSL